MARLTASPTASSQTRSPSPQIATDEPRAEEDAAALAGYIADMASELSRLAAGADFQMVAYFLNLARVEAEIRSRELGGCFIDREK